MGLLGRRQVDQAIWPTGKGTSDEGEDLEDFITCRRSRTHVTLHEEKLDTRDSPASAAGNSARMTMRCLKFLSGFPVAPAANNRFLGRRFGTSLCTPCTVGSAEPIHTSGDHFPSKTTLLFFRRKSNSAGRWTGRD